MIITGILARGLSPDLRASEYCEWTPFFSLIISESSFLNIVNYDMQHDFILEAVLIIVLIMRFIASMH